MSSYVSIFMQLRRWLEGCINISHVFGRLFRQMFVAKEMKLGACFVENLMRFFLSINERFEIQFNALSSPGTCSICQNEWKRRSTVARVHATRHSLNEKRKVASVHLSDRQRINRTRELQFLRQSRQFFSRRGQRHGGKKENERHHGAIHSARHSFFAARRSKSRGGCLLGRDKRDITVDRPAKLVSPGSRAPGNAVNGNEIRQSGELA